MSPQIKLIPIKKQPENYSPNIHTTNKPQISLTFTKNQPNKNNKIENHQVENPFLLKKIIERKKTTK